MLRVSSLLVCILSLTLTLHLLVEWYFAKPAKASAAISVEPLRPRTVVKQPTLEDYKTIATVPILEEIPPVVIAKPSVKLPAPPPNPLPVVLPLTWAGVAVHSNPKKSVAFVFDKRSNKQLHLREGTVLPNSPWRVVQITNKAVVLQAGETKASVEKPKPAQITAPSQSPKIVVPENGGKNHEIMPPEDTTPEQPAAEDQPPAESQSTEERER
jgi:hypothetical protein